MRLALLLTLILVLAPAVQAQQGWQPFSSTYWWTRSDGDVFRYKLEMEGANRIRITIDYTPSAESIAVDPRHAVSVVDFYRLCRV